MFCVDVLPTSAIEYKNWKGRQICVKRMKTNYLDLSIASNSQTCPLNQKPCGIILGNILCIDSYTPCPYNDLKVSLQSDQGSGNIKVGDVYYNYSNRTTNGRTSIQFQISDKQPCTLPYYENTNEN
jgi:hypothetical protein